MSDLPGDISRSVKTLCAEGDRLADKKKYPEALQRYRSAWDLLPDPKTQWPEARGILAAVGDAHFLTGDFAAGMDNLQKAMHCPAAIGNPFLHLRLGQCRYELGDLDRAADELTRALMGGGTEIFDVDDKKYFEFLKTRLKPPPGGW